MADTAAERLDALAKAMWDADDIGGDACSAAMVWDRPDFEAKEGMIAQARAALRWLGLDPEHPPAAGAGKAAAEALRATASAYQGVGDFAGTGENMVAVIGQVRAALAELEGGR